MSAEVIIDWRFALALGVAFGIVILCWKMTPDAAERVAIHGIDAC